MRAREHVAGMHQHFAEHHAELAKTHAALGAHHRVLQSHHEADDADLARIHEQIAVEHERLAKCHAEAGDFHRANCEALKASATDTLDKVVPSEVSAINKNPGAGGSTLFTRPGQPTIAGNAVVPADLQKFVSLGE